MTPSVSAVAPARRWLPATVCITLVALLFLPFANKAFHIDDYYFLVWGDLFDWNPLRALPNDFPHQGTLVEDILPYSLTHPLLIPYLLKLMQHLFGTSELPLHLVFLVFPLLVLWSLAKLSALLDSVDCQTTFLLLLFGTLPAFVVNGQNLMTDVPMLAFLLAGTVAVVKCVNGECGETPWLGSFWLTCAVFTSYQALAFVVLLIGFVWVACRSRRHKLNVLLALCLPLVLMLLWLLLVYGLYGVFPGQRDSGVGGELIRGSQWQVVWGRVVFDFAMIGASLVFVLPFYLATLSRRGFFRAGSACGVLLVIFFLVAPPEAGEFPRRAALAAFCALGAVGIGCAMARLWTWFASGRSRPVVFLCGGWILLTLLYNVILLPFGNARYLLPIFPILFIVLLHGSPAVSFRFPRLAGVLLLCSLLWGGANAWADYYHAGTYRTMAAELAEFRQALGGDRQVWYVGEWGMRHYFDQAGARYLLANSTEPKAGDYVVIPEMPRFWAPSPRLRPRLTFYASREFRSPLPLRLFNRRSGAGFYCHHWGLLPFTFSSEPDELFVIQEVR